MTVQWIMIPILLFTYVQPLTSVLQFVASKCVVISPWFHPATFAHNQPLKRFHCLRRLKDLERFLVRDAFWWKGIWEWFDFSSVWNTSQRLQPPSTTKLTADCRPTGRRLLPSVHGAETTSTAAHGRGRCHLWTSSFEEFKEVNLVSTRITQIP